MPLVSQITGPPVEPPTPVPDPGNTDVPVRKRITWTGPDGSVHILTDVDAGFGSLRGRSGFGVAPRDVLYDDLATGGGLLRDIHDKPRVVHIPLAIWGDSQAEFLARWRPFVASLRHTIGGRQIPGMLTVQLGDGTTRRIAAYYLDGADPTEWVNRKGATITDLQFLALSPHWLGEPVTFRVTYPEAGSYDFFPLLPVKLAPSTVSTGGAVAITSPGDAQSWPVWRITGPGTPRLESLTSGQKIEFTAAVPDGRTVTIDTRPPELAPDTALTAVDDLGDNWWPSLTQFPDLWPLEPGVNTVELAMSGATGDTRIDMALDPAYQAAW